MSSINIYLNNTCKKSTTLLKILRNYNNHMITFMPSIFNSSGDYKKYLNGNNYELCQLQQIKRAHCAIFLKDNRICDEYEMFNFGYIKGKYSFLPIFAINNSNHNSSLLHNFSNIHFNVYNKNINEIGARLYQFLDKVGDDNNINNLENKSKVSKTDIVNDTDDYINNNNFYIMCYKNLIKNDETKKDVFLL